MPDATLTINPSQAFDAYLTLEAASGTYTATSATYSVTNTDNNPVTGFTNLAGLILTAGPASAVEAVYNVASIGLPLGAYLVTLSLVAFDGVSSVTKTQVVALTVSTTDIDYALPSGSGVVYDPDTTVGIPPTYAIVYHAGNSRLFLSPAGSQTIVAFKWDITDVDGGTVPVPTSITINLLDADGQDLTPPVTSSPNFDNHTSSASTQTIGGRLTLPTPAEVTQVYYVQLIVWLDNGTGVQKLVTETVIRIRSY